MHTLYMVGFLRYYDFDYYEDMLDKLQSFADGSAEVPPGDDSVRKVAEHIDLCIFWFKADKEEFWDNYFKEVRISKIHAHLARIDSENESEDMKKWRNAALSRMRKDGRDNTTKKFDRMTRDMHPFERLEKYGVPV